MSARRYVLTGTVEDGTKQIEDMQNIYDKGYVSLTFYLDEELTQLITPTSGTVTITVSETGDVYGSIPNGVIEANNIGPDRTYVRPNWGGSATHLKILFTGITYATHFKCEITRSGGA